MTAHAGLTFQAKHLFKNRIWRTSGKMTIHSELEVPRRCFTPSRDQTFAYMLCVILFQLGCSNSEIICESSYTMYDADTEYIPEQDSHTLTIDTFSDTVSHANRMRSFLVEGTLLISDHLDERTFTNTTSIFFSDDASSGEIVSSADYRVEIDICLLYTSPSPRDS